MKITKAMLAEAARIAKCPTSGNEKVAVFACNHCGKVQGHTYIPYSASNVHPISMCHCVAVNKFQKTTPINLEVVPA